MAKSLQGVVRRRHPLDLQRGNRSKRIRRPSRDASGVLLGIVLRHGDANFPQYGTRKWYEIVRDQSPAIRAARFDLVWLPPPSYAGDKSAGYNPKEYYRLDNSYGSWSQHRVMLETLLQQGIEPIADIVINHRDGSISWDYIKEHPGCDLRAYFKNPDWGLWAITKYDSVFSKDDSPLKNTPMDQRGAAEEIPSEYARHGGTTYEYDSFSDIDHTNPQVRKDILRYLFQLKSAGYRGWRYDVVHGYHAKRLALYNLRSNPTFSVGEYEWEQGQYPATTRLVLVLGCQSGGDRCRPFKNVQFHLRFYDVMDAPK